MEDSKLLQEKFFPEWSIDQHSSYRSPSNLRRNEQAGPKIWMECKETGTGKILKNKNKVRGTSFLISKHNHKFQLSKGIVLAKQTVVYPYNEVQFINRNEWITDTCCDMDDIKLLW